jgi:hypothetical protein
MADSNPTFVYTTGPVHAFVRFLPNTPIQYLGTTVQAPEYDRQKRYAPVWSALGGDQEEFDRRYGGSPTTIGLDLMKHSDPVLSQVEAAPRHGRDDGEDGTELMGDIGKMMAQGGGGYEGWLVNTFAMWGGAALSSFPTVRRGYYFRCLATDRVFRGKDGLGESVVRVDLSALKVYDPRTMSFFRFSSDPQFFTQIPFPL